MDHRHNVNTDRHVIIDTFSSSPDSSLSLARSCANTHWHQQDTVTSNTSCKLGQNNIVWSSQTNKRRTGTGKWDMISCGHRHSKTNWSDLPGRLSIPRLNRASDVTTACMSLFFFFFFLKSLTLLSSPTYPLDGELAASQRSTALYGSSQQLRQTFIKVSQNADVMLHFPCCFYDDVMWYNTVALWICRLMTVDTMDHFSKTSWICLNQSQ